MYSSDYSFTAVRLHTYTPPVYFSISVMWSCGYVYNIQYVYEYVIIIVCARSINGGVCSASGVAIRNGREEALYDIIYYYSSVVPILTMIINNLIQKL